MAEERFDTAVVSGLVACGGPNGYTSYYRFPSSKARVAAVQRSAGLISNELFCAKGAELVVNDLLGYDQTSGFCRKLGFPIHRPTHEFSPAQRRVHSLEDRAAGLVRNVTGEPNVWCEHFGGRLEFECVEPISGKTSDIELVRRGHRFVTKGCENLGDQGTKKSPGGETCAGQSRAR